MRLIAHRGNLERPNPDFENNPQYIMNAINLGYDAEIDLRIDGGELYLGHDYAQYRINESFLTINSFGLWIHCKDVLALGKCMNVPNLNYFWHQDDDYTLTSKNIIWAYPGKTPVAYTIMVMPELFWQDKNEVINLNPYGICTDYVLNYTKKDYQ